jgi:uncharacterized membrane protein YeaQ/YmgE (transglycosylase-associated protein family)
MLLSLWRQTELRLAQCGGFGGLIRVETTGLLHCRARILTSTGLPFGVGRSEIAQPTSKLEIGKMHMSGQSLLVIVLVGIVAGWLAGQIVRGTGFGIIGDLIIGIIGAFIGDWLLPQLGIHLGVGIVAAIINATIGAVVLLFIVTLVRGGGRFGGGRGWGRRW